MNPCQVPADELREGVFGVEIDIAAQQLPIVGVAVERGRVAMEGHGIHRQTGGAGRPEVYVDANITVEDRGMVKKNSSKQEIIV